MTIKLPAITTSIHSRLQVPSFIMLLIHLGGTGLNVAQDGVHLLSDYTGRASGEAFVHFIDKGHAQEALNRDREKIGHRWGDYV